MHRQPRTAATLLAVAGSLLLLAVPAAAQKRPVDRPEEITAPALPAFEIPQPRRVELPNGMVVMLIEDHELPLVRATAIVNTGSRLEPANHAGVASVTGSVLRSGGTTRMSADALDDYLEDKAAIIESSIGDDQGRVMMSSLAEDFEEVLAVFADVLRRPAFAADRVDIALTAERSSVARQNDNPQQILFREIQELVYGEDSPYARTPTYASLAAIDRDDVVAWHEQYFHPNRVVLGLAGDFDAERALARVREVFGDWEPGPEPAAPPALAGAPKPGVFVVEKADMTQSNIGMGAFGIRRDAPDYFPVRVLNEVLSGSMSARLFTEIRTRRGLAYAVSGQVGSDWDRPGMTLFFTTTKVSTTAEAIRALLGEANAIRGERPPTADEVARAKQSILASFVFNVDSAEEVLNQQLAFEYYGYPLDWLSAYRGRIEAVDTAQVQAAAKAHLAPDELSILVVGPAEGRDGDLSEFGTVTPVDVTIPVPAAPRAEASAEAAGRAGELIAQAVAAAGGAERLAGVEAIRVRATVTANTPGGEMEIATVQTRAFPDRLHQEMVLPMGTLAMAVTPDDAFMVTPQGVAPIPTSAAAESRTQIMRDPIGLLLMRDDPSFQAVAAGSGTVDGTAVEEVEIELLGTLTRAAIDPASGHILALTYQGTGMGGDAPGEVRETFSDFRAVEGVSYPYLAVQSFDGETQATTRVESVEINPELDASLFVRPE